jgi:hypothetical protein
MASDAAGAILGDHAASQPIRASMARRMASGSDGRPRPLPRDPRNGPADLLRLPAAQDNAAM